MRLVVGAAIVVDGRVLAARRRGHADGPERDDSGRDAGWEFPGGKVEPGEQPGDALIREIAEELGIEVTVTAWLPGRGAISDDWELAVAVVGLVGPVPATLRSTDHDELRWLGADAVDTVGWLPADRPFLTAVAAELRARG